MNNFKQVSSDEFYKFIGPKNVTVTPQGNYPYRTSFKLQGVEIAYQEKNGKYYLLTA